MRDPKQIVRALDTIALLLSLSGKDGWKAQAYARGARAVSSLGGRLGPLIDEGRLDRVPGIGRSLSRQIVELWSTGRSSLLDRLSAEYPPGAAELAPLPGMTLRRMRVLSETLGVASRADLQAALAAGRLRDLPGFGERTEAKLAQALAEVDARGGEPEPAPRRMLLADALGLAAQLERVLSEAGAAVEVQLAGAARRGEELVSELELLVVTADAESVWSALERWPGAIVLDRRLGLVQLALGVPLCLHVAPPEQAGARLLFATGPKAHLAALTERARTRELALSERGLSLASAAHGGATSAEAELYRALQLPFVPPELRATASELAAVPAQGYVDLLEAADLRGAVHCHTTYSDGKDSIEAMALAAQALGMQYITITDHSPSAHYAGGVELDRLKRQWDEIAEVQERVAIRILRGTESDILADGALDYPDAILEQFDVVIASIHARFKMDAAALTERLTRALGLPLFKIWGHALGRQLLSREPFRCDVPRVLDVLAAAGGAVEINSDPHRLDLAPEWLTHARARELPFVISVDAHSTGGLAAYRLGVTMARRAGITRGEVLNTLPPEAFARKVRPAGEPAEDVVL